MASEIARTAYFSILRWILDIARDEPRNLAVILVDSQGGFAKFKAAPLDTIIPKPKEQVVLRAMLKGLERQLKETCQPDFAGLMEMHKQQKGSIRLTKPRPIKVIDPDAKLDDLYQTYVASPETGTGELVERVMYTLSELGITVERNKYLGEYAFDITAFGTGAKPIAIQVFSFEGTQESWLSEEHSAAYFVSALGKIKKVVGASVIRPPSSDATDDARVAHDRLVGWFNKRGVLIVNSDNLADGLTGLVNASKWHGAEGV